MYNKNSFSCTNPDDMNYEAFKECVNTISNLFPRACLKIAFYKMCFTLCGRFGSHLRFLLLPFWTMSTIKNSTPALTKQGAIFINYFRRKRIGVNYRIGFLVRHIIYQQHGFCNHNLKMPWCYQHQSLSERYHKGL